MPHPKLAILLVFITALIRGYTSFGIGTLAGIPIGLFILTNIPDIILKLTMSIPILAIASWLLRLTTTYLSPNTVVYSIHG